MMQKQQLRQIPRVEENLVIRWFLSALSRIEKERVLTRYILVEFLRFTEKENSI